MAENLKRQPKKGILKNSSSFESNDRQREQKNGTKWDEMNIIATLHPADKDYGHMKIDEPKTPYNYRKDDSGSGDELDSIDVDLLTQRLQAGAQNPPRALVTPPPIEEEEEEDDDDDDVSPEEMEIRRHFEMKRKKHYNEFQAVKLARKLMEQEDSDEFDEDGTDKDTSHEKRDETMDADESKSDEAMTSDDV